MKLLFAHDNIFLKYDNIYFDGYGAFPSDVLKRYTSVFETVNFVSRQKQVSSKSENFTPASTERVEFINIENFKTLKTFYRILEAKKKIEEEVNKVDCVIARLPSSIGYIAVNAAVKNNIPYAVEVVGCPWDSLWNYGNIEGKILAPYEFMKMKKIVKKAPFVLYVTDTFLQERYPTRGVTINCSNVEIIRPQNEVLESRQINNQRFNKNKVIKIGMIGSLGSRFKGFDLAMEAIKNLSETYKNIELHILGSGDKVVWEKYARELGVEDKVFFVGTLPSGKAVLEWLDEINIYIQPSKQEGLPRALIEAMSRGCPAVGSNTAGIPELLDEEFIHKKGDSIDLANKIEQLIASKKIKLQQSERNFHFANNYSKDVLDKRRADYYMNFKENVEKINLKEYEDGVSSP
ncbi:glycosyltransferase family 4 protein [Alkalihalobacillus sp. BA299]|uniref:glycosyltransferase family 4 protein n=1 Tax=Alkalihalobacillus sp. BA299 TaxID=2815938 RepID=UPI001ADA0E68|nr:glycosyltransferase family 4 protein [Alkalihalobacillus sp. BA299]